jgi:hypothetical protein
LTNLRDINVTNLPLTAFGDLRTAELSPIFQISFEYTVDNTYLVRNAVVNGGTVTQSQAMAVVGTSTTTGSSAYMRSYIPAKYRAGLGGLFRFTALYTAPIAGTAQLHGLADTKGSSTYFKNGFMVGYVGTTFGFHRFRNDELFTIPLADFDDPLDGTGASGGNIDPTKLNVFYIDFQYLGAGAIRIYHESELSGDVDLVHTLLYSNLNTVPSTFNPNFFGTVYTDNGATSSDMIAKIASMAFFVEGKSILTELHQPQFSTGKVTKSGVTTETPILTIRNKSIYAGLENFIEVILEEQVSSIEAGSPNNLAEIRLKRNATLGGTPSWVDINTTNSVVEMDTSATTVSGGEIDRDIPLAGKNDKSIDNIISLRFILAPGESITVTGESASSAVIKASLLWKELF